jgi:hypothetical protein
MKRPRHKAPLDKAALKNVSVPFRRELRAAQRTYDHLTSALKRRDPARVHVTACQLALAWLQVEIAFIRFIERSPAELGLGPQARRERSILTWSNHMVRDWFRRALWEASTWAISPDELRALREILCWLYERLGWCSVVGFPDLSAPHACPFNLPGKRSHNQSTRRGVRK